MGLEASQENVEREEVVRVFLLQPIDPTQINKLTNYTDLNLTEVVLIKKNKQSNNPGAFMPIGGAKKTNESFEDAARREALDETHLIFSDLIKMKNTQEYSFQNRGRLAKRKAYYFIGKLFAPRYDVPYPLDNESDKIESFVSFSRTELKELIDGKRVEGGQIFDGLNGDRVTRKKANVFAKNKEIHAIRDELSENLMSAEVERKMSVLKLLIYGGFGSRVSEKVVSDFASLEENLEKDSPNFVNKYKKVSKFWKDNINSLVDSPEILRIALEFSNLQDIFLDLEKYQKKPGDTLPTIHMMFPVMFGLNFDIRFLDLFKREPHLEKIYAMSRILFLYNNMQTGQRGAASERLLRRFLKKKEGEVGEKEMVDYFKEMGFLSTEFEFSFQDLGKSADTFLSDLRGQAQIPASAENIFTSPDTMGKSLQELLALAFGSTDKRIKFEAQRKLLLIQLAFENRNYYEKVTKKGIKPLDELEEKLEVNDGSATVRMEGKTRIKKTKLSLNGKPYPVTIYQRVKEEESQLRKVLVRDALDFSETSPYNDIYGESYVFDEEAIGEMEIVEREDPFSVPDGKDGKIKKYLAPLIVHNYFKELKSKLGAGEKIEILQFKGLPQEGTGVESNSVGGGAKLRFLKFYLRHTDINGTERTREVQMFLPKTENGKTISGEVDYKAKKDDDERYGLARLFTHGNVYSLIELLFPHHVYGDRMKEFFKVKKHD